MAEMAVRSRGLYPEVGRAVRSGNPEWGPGREVTGAGDAGGAKMASLLGQVEGSSGPDLNLGIKARCIPGWLFLLLGHMCQSCQRVWLLTHNQCSHYMPYASAPITRYGSNEKSHSCWKQRVQNPLGKTGMCAELECWT